MQLADANAISVRAMGRLRGYEKGAAARLDSNAS